MAFKDKAMRLLGNLSGREGGLAPAAPGARRVLYKYLGEGGGIRFSAFSRESPASRESHAAQLPLAATIGDPRRSCLTMKEQDLVRCLRRLAVRLTPSYPCHLPRRPLGACRRLACHWPVSFWLPRS